MLQRIDDLVRSIEARCRVCDNESDNQCHTVLEMMFGSRQPFQYMECAGCGCLQLTNHPADMSVFYPDNYYSFIDSPAKSRNRRWKQWRTGLRNRYAATGRGLVGRMLNRNRPTSNLESLRPLRLKSSARIIDVGCGAGQLLGDLSLAGFRKLYGIDPFVITNSDRADGVRIESRSIFEVNMRADVIMFHHSFEHLDNPKQTLARCHDLLNPQGWCLLRIPVADSYAWQHYSTDWVQLDAPRHYFLHTLKSIELLASETGFRLEQVRHDSSEFQFWGSEQYRLGIPLRDNRSYAESPEHGPFSIDQMERFRQMANELNAKQMGDQAAFYLSRR